MIAIDRNTQAGAAAATARAATATAERWSAAAVLLSTQAGGLGMIKQPRPGPRLAGTNLRARAANPRAIGANPWARTMAEGEVTIVVDAARIDSAVRRKLGERMIAEAVQAALPAAANVRVDVGSIRWTVQGVRYSCRTPAAT